MLMYVPIVYGFLPEINVFVLQNDENVNGTCLFIQAKYIFRTNCCK